MSNEKSIKYIILVGDGMGDLPLPELDGRTPLEAANTPAMDYLASHGEFYSLRTIPPGYAPGSDVANLSLLGYLPQECYTGRAPLEAASMGVNLKEDEIAFRCNLVTLKEDAERLIMVDYSSGHISSAEAKILIEAIEKELGGDLVHFHPGVSYRHLMVHKGALPILETVPPHDHTGKDVSAFWKRYCAIPHLKDILERACRILDTHEVNAARRAKGLNPANAIWLWGEGKAPDMPTLAEQYGITGALISAVDLLKGIGVYAGMEIINVPGATGYLDTNYAGKVEAALSAVQSHDLVFVHVEAPDEASHQGLLAEKIRAIEDFDGKIVQPILDGLRESGTAFRLVIAMDHFTPLSIQTHADLPVPMALYDSRHNAADSGLGFCEKNASENARRMYENGRQFLRDLLEKE